MKKIYCYSLLLTFSYLILGCTPDLVVKPDNLKNAVIGKPYYDEIIITGGPGPVLPGSFTYTIKPNDSGLELYILGDDAPFNHFAVKGTPVTSQDIAVHLQGEASTRDPIDSAKILDKTYIIKVKEAEK